MPPHLRSVPPLDPLAGPAGTPPARDPHDTDSDVVFARGRLSVSAAKLFSLLLLMLSMLGGYAINYLRERNTIAEAEHKKMQERLDELERWRVAATSADAVISPKELDQKLQSVSEQVTKVDTKVDAIHDEIRRHWR